MLDPQAQALLDLMKKRGVPATNELTPIEARQAYRDRRFYTQPDPPAVGNVQDLSADGPHGPIPLRSYRPAGSDVETVLPALIYFHGGGWVIGDLDTHEVLCRELCNLSGCAVIAVDYRMGPEHRFPASVKDVKCVLGQLRAQSMQAVQLSSRSAMTPRARVGGASLACGYCTVAAPPPILRGLTVCTNVFSVTDRPLPYSL